jgi:hypothetical protein
MSSAPNSGPCTYNKYSDVLYKIDHMTARSDNKDILVPSNLLGRLRLA